uniref:Uncharacterized protein n=1 Tax=viral metagenome TaxID=1070528 RepID=A0A6C0DCJ7_9ZZZZ
MYLVGPKKQTDGSYLVGIDPPKPGPALKWKDGAWIPNEQWLNWANICRDIVLGMLVSKPAWFSRPPRRDTLDSIFTPWAGQRLSGELFLADSQNNVPTEGVSGTAVRVLTAVRMTPQSITPVWTVNSIVPDPDVDTISLFGSDDEEDDAIKTVPIVAPVKEVKPAGHEENSDEVREVHLDDVAPVTGISAPTHIRSREWEARKFMAKERVREARLKAQMADRIAAREERRFYTQFGDLDETESHFSEYDLTDEESDAEEAEDAN